MPRKREAINISISKKAREGLENLARKHGYYWGERPNISELIERIGLSEITPSVYQEKIPFKNSGLLLEERQQKKALELIKEVLDKLSKLEPNTGSDGSDRQ
ncbi:MAG: hypothetical protein AB4426_02785 [Xenococcaceae cyanobacterium]